MQMRYSGPTRSLATIRTFDMCSCIQVERRDTSLCKSRCFEVANLFPPHLDEGPACSRILNLVVYACFLQW